MLIFDINLCKIITKYKFCYKNHEFLNSIEKNFFEDNENRNVNIIILVIYGNDKRIKLIY